MKIPFSDNNFDEKITIALFLINQTRKWNKLPHEANFGKKR